MVRLRTSRLFRALAVVLALSVGALLWAPLQGSDEASSEYSRWLRAQADGTTDAAFDAALDRAQQTESASLSGFLTAFADAYQELAPEGDLGQVFAAPHLSVDALLMYLQTRSTGAAADAVNPRVLMGLHKLAPQPSPDRTLTAALQGLLQHRAAYTPLLQHERLRAAPVVVTPLRMLFSARPMAP